MNKCNFCGNRNFVKTKVQYIYKYDGKLLIVDNVPCIKCEYCGESYFEGVVLEKIENTFNEIYEHGRKPKENVEVPFEEFEE